MLTNVFFHVALTGYIGQVVKFGDADPEMFRALLIEYGYDVAKSPLIKRILVRCNSHVLQNGAILVDLPGEGDTSRVRVANAKEYYSKCKYIWVLTASTRALTDMYSHRKSVLQFGMLSSHICEKNSFLACQKTR